MGLNTKFKNVACHRCETPCNIAPQRDPQAKTCLQSYFCTWPQESIYFTRGIIDGIACHNHHSQFRGHIFIDFSISFLRLFLDSAWVNYLATSRMNLILFSDRHLQPLANYWRKNHRAISTVIYPDDSLDIINEKIRHVLNGRRLSINKGSTLTEREVLVLKRMAAGQDSHRIAEQLGKDIRSIYAYKLRIEKRMGNSINTLFLHSYPVKEKMATAMT